jgi:hypothetical protein
VPKHPNSAGSSGQSARRDQRRTVPPPPQVNASAEEQRPDDTTGPGAATERIYKVRNVGEGAVVLQGENISYSPILGGVYYSPLRLNAPLRRVFDPLLYDFNVLFGGREEELDHFGAFIRDPSGGYLVLRAPAGFGKTALLAALVNRNPEAFAYHFFDPRHVPDSTLERFFLQNVIQQMAQWHGREGELPTAVPELKALYHELLDEQLDRPQILVLDGIDEVTQWSMRFYLNRALPSALHVIVSVRDVGQDWMADYGFPGSQTRLRSLGGLTTQDIAQVLRAAGPRAGRLAEDPSVLDQVTRVVAYQEDPRLGADPFYVRVLAEDLQARQMTPESIAVRPPGLDDYLNRWWQALREAAGEGPAGDLLGLLTVAVGPISRRELEAISPSLAGGWAGDLFERQILPSVRRFLVGDDEQGYSLMNSRLHQYMRRRISTLPAYRAKLLAYCADWNRHLSRYALDYFAAHLAEDPDNQEDRARLFALVNDRSWYEAKITHDPSGAGYLRDNELAWSVAAAIDRKAVDQGEKASLLSWEVRSALAIASIHGLSQRMRSSLLVALVTTGLWRPDRALSLVRLNPHSMARNRTLAALAPHLPESCLPDAVDIARGIEDDDQRAEALVNMASSLAQSERPAVVEEALSAARSIRDPADRASTLMLVAEEASAPLQQQALSEAGRAIHELGDVGERAEMLAQLVSALPEQEREPMVAEALEAAQEAADPWHAVNVVTSLANVLPEQQSQFLLEKARDVAANVEDPRDQALMLIKLASSPRLPESHRQEVLSNILDTADRTQADWWWGLSEIREGLTELLTSSDETSIGPSPAQKARTRRAIDAAYGISDMSQRASILAALAIGLGEPETARVAEDALAYARTAPDGASRARRLAELAWHLPPPYRSAALEDAWKTARQVSEPAERAAVLISVALALEDPHERRQALQEALRIPGALEAARGAQRDEIEVVEAIADIAPRLTKERRNATVRTALTLARRINRPYDRARALAALAPHLPAAEARDLALEALEATRSIEDVKQRAQILTMLLPTLPDPQREEAFEEALTAARNLGEHGSIETFTISEDGVIDHAFVHAHFESRESILSALAEQEPGKCSVLLQEALDGIYNMIRQQDQWQALAELAPLLPGEAVRRVLTDLRAIQREPTRVRAMAMLISAWAEQHGGDAGRREAQAIWGDEPPADIVAALAAAGVDGTERKLPTEDKDSPEAGVPQEPSNKEEESVSSNGEASLEPNDFNVRVAWEPVSEEFLANMYRLSKTPVQALLTVDFDPPPPWPYGANPEEMEQLVHLEALKRIIPEMSTEEFRDAFDAAAEFITGASWTQIRLALISRLLDLGLEQAAVEEVRAMWPQTVPLEARIILASHLSAEERSAALHDAVLAALEIEPETDRANALADLLPDLSEPERSDVVREIRLAAQAISDGARSGEDNYALHMLMQTANSILPSHLLLRIWQRTLQVASSGARRDLLMSLASLLEIVEPIGGEGVWLETADQIFQVHSWWP